MAAIEGYANLLQRAEILDHTVEQIRVLIQSAEKDLSKIGTSKTDEEDVAFAELYKNIDLLKEIAEQYRDSYDMANISILYGPLQRDIFR